MAEKDLYALIDSLPQDFNAWAHKFFLEEGYVNKAIEKMAMRDAFLHRYPQYRMLLDMKSFKRLLVIFSEKERLFFNPTRFSILDRRMKSNGNEYFLLADTNLDACRIPHLKSITI